MCGFHDIISLLWGFKSLMISVLTLGGIVGTFSAAAHQKLPRRFPDLQMNGRILHALSFLFK
jgi:hypothetical protein